MACLYQRGKKRVWWIKYYVRGRPVHRSLHTTNARVAERTKKQIEGEAAKGELLAPSKTPLPALLEDYCRFMSTFRTPKSYSADVSVLRVFFGPICPSLELGTRVVNLLAEEVGHGDIPLAEGLSDEYGASFLNIRSGGRALADDVILLDVLGIIGVVRVQLQFDLLG